MVGALSAGGVSSAVSSAGSGLFASTATVDGVSVLVCKAPVAHSDGGLELSLEVAVFLLELID